MNEQTRKVVIPAIVGVAGLSVGGVLGYILGQRRSKGIPLTDEWHRPIGRVTSVKNTEDGISVTGVIQDESIKRVITRATLDSISLVTDENAPGHIIRVEPIDEEDEAEPKIINIFDNSDPNWDWEAELSSRSSKTLYVITKGEFFADDMGYRQSTITWYELDRTMADEREAPIYNWSSLVGVELPFGHGSGDEDVVYIRNEELRHEYEVCHDVGAHGVEVEGMEIEEEYEDQDIKHSRYPLKFRLE